MTEAEAAGFPGHAVVPPRTLWRLCRHTVCAPTDRQRTLASRSSLSAPQRTTACGLFTAHAASRPTRVKRGRRTRLVGVAEHGARRTRIWAWCLGDALHIHSRQPPARACRPWAARACRPWPHDGICSFFACVAAGVSDADCWQRRVVGRGQGVLQHPTAPRCALLPVKRHQECAPDTKSAFQSAAVVCFFGAWLSERAAVATSLPLQPRPEVT